MIEERNLKEIPEVVFLIGAGVSVPLDIPAMHGIFEAFMNKRKSGINQNEKKICKMLIKELGVKEDLEDFLLAANTIIQSKDSNLLKLIEKSISRQRKSNRLKEFRLKLNNHIKDIKLVRKRILEFMSRTCFQFDRSKACDIFSNFVKAIASSGYPIYTTNYDFAFEYVAQENDVIIQDNFIRKGQRNIWNTQIEFPIGNALTIIKLHGSVTWYADDAGTIEKIYANTDLNPLGREIERLVVFPTRFKDIYDQHFFALYSHFLSALAKAKCMVVIGHSLRDDYLRAGIIERFRKGDFKLIVIDPHFPKSLLAEMKPTPIGRYGQVTHVPMPFETFSDDLSDIIENTDSTDIARKCAAIVKYGRARTNKVKIKGKLGTLKPGQKKQFKVAIDSYIPQDKKPAYIRVWLKANYRTPTGEEKKEVSGSYIDEGSTPIAAGLSGLVRKEIPITIEVPNYQFWLDHAGKVTLCVGVLTKRANKPNKTNPDSILAIDDRKLSYSQ